MTYILNAITSYPEFRVNQDDVKKLLISKWPSKTKYIEKLSSSNCVEGRNLTLPLNYYQDLFGIGKKNIIWKAEAFKLQKENLKNLLETSGIDISDIAMIVSATSTGLMAPTLENLIINEFGFSPETIKIPLFGQGSSASIAGINLISEYLSTHPKKAAILMVTELSSLSFQINEDKESSMYNMISFGDGAGAVLMVGENHPLGNKKFFEIMGGISFLIPESEQVIKLDITDNGFEMRYSNDIPKLIKENLKEKINLFLGKFKITKEDISFYLVHPEEPAILETFAEALSCSNDKFALSWKSLSARGNIPGVSFLQVLEETISSADIAPGGFGLMISTGPGFCLEFSLVKKCF